MISPPLRLRAITVALGVSVLVACADQHARGASRRMADVIVLDGPDTIRTEQFESTDSSLSGVIAYSRVRSPSSARVPGLELGDTIDYYASLRADGSARHVRVRLAEASVHHVPATTRETDVPNGMSLLIPGSLGAIDVAMMRARRSNTATVELPVWTGDPSAPAHAVITFDAGTRDSATFRFVDSWRLAIDGAGSVADARIVGGTVHAVIRALVGASRSP